MPRTTNDEPITTRASRAKLAARHEPYWRGKGDGAALGYRKGARGGVWVVRLKNERGGYDKATLGRADDDPADAAAGIATLDFGAADAAAQAWIVRQRRIAAGLEPEPTKDSGKPLTVNDVLEAYFQDQAKKRKKGLDRARLAAAAHIRPKLGNVVVGRLTRDRLRGWHHELAEAPPRVRSGKGKTKAREVDPHDEDAQRRRRSSANRVLTILKAALNFARTEGIYAGSNDPWKLVKPHAEADAPTVRYLQADEITRLCNACPPDFRELVTGALLTGARYGELAAMRVSAFNPDVGTLAIPRSKSGKPRHIVLTDEGAAFFSRMTAGRKATARMFERDLMVKQATGRVGNQTPAEFTRAPWGRSHQFRFLREACAAAKIVPAISFHILRHTYASRLAQNGASMQVIAAQLGHADTRITEKHYAHLGPSHIANVVRGAFGNLGIGAAVADNVTPLRRQISQAAGT